MSMLLLAQNMPDPKLLEGGAQQILVWVILALVALYVVTVGYLVRKLSAQEDKYDALQQKCIKLAVRSQRAIEALADLPPPEIENDLDDKDKE